MGRPSIEELDYQQTTLGELILRRRNVRSLDNKEIFEVKLDGQFLMSSLTNSAEIALTTIALGSLSNPECDVLVGGLGLGYTAKAALDSGKVRSVTVIEYLAPIIQWHKQALVPLGAELVGDSRCHFVHDDFFRFMKSEHTAIPDQDHSHPRSTFAVLPQRYHAILLDIDHSPQSLLQPSHAEFYRQDGLAHLIAKLQPDGVFALWSAEAPLASFLRDLETVFRMVAVHESHFFNPLLNEDDVNYIITGRGI